MIQLDSSLFMQLRRRHLLFRLDEAVLFPQHLDPLLDAPTNRLGKLRVGGRLFQPFLIRLVVLHLVVLIDVFRSSQEQVGFQFQCHRFRLLAVVLHSFERAGEGGGVTRSSDEGFAVLDHIELETADLHDTTMSIREIHARVDEQENIP